jgi:Holliday junction resolvasome RuvABC DNA-binding subunit
VTDRTWFLLFGSVNIHLHFGPISEFWQARRRGAFNALIKHSGLAASTALALLVT